MWVDEDGRCKKCGIGLGSVLTMAGGKCPECKTETKNSELKRCCKCAKQKNKCSQCDGPLNI